jgi:PAS domain S-box-containing protein
MSRTPPGWPRALRDAVARALWPGESPPRSDSDAQHVRASEERLLSALRSGRTVAWEWDLLTDRVIRSENCAELLGLPVESDARQGGEFMKVVHPDDRERVGLAVRRAMETGDPVETVFRLVRTDGRILWVLDEGKFDVDVTGRPVRMSGIIRDITEWKHEEGARQDTERALADLRDQLSAELAIVVRLHEMSTRFVQGGDLTRLLEEVLDAALVIARTDLGQVRLHEPGTNTLRLVAHRGFSADYVGRFAEISASVGALGVAMSRRERLVVEDLRSSALFPDHVRAAEEAEGVQASLFTPLLGRSGEILGMISAHFRTPRRPSERELRLTDLFARQAADFVEHSQARAARDELLARELSARAEAEDANRAKDEFLAMLSHELRTPLNAMLGWVRMLRAGRLDPAGAAHGLEVIERNIRHQTQIIADLLDVSRIISGKLTIDLQPVDLAPAIESAVETLRPAAHARNVTLTADLQASAGTVAGDAARLEQVVSNLLTNALKFTSAGGEVHVALSRRGDWAHLTVRDTGVGIRPDFLPHLFERFRQADSSSTRVHGGLGLGLAIVRHLVEVHGGRVHANSEGEGKGATFTVELPILSAEPLGRWSSRRWTADHRRVDLTGVRVLLVDDDLDTLDVVKIALGEQGASVQVACSVAEAWDHLMHAPADVLVSDISMPGEDGFDLMRRMRASGGRIAAIPAIALSAFARHEDASRAAAAGFQRHLAKPVELGELVVAVAMLSGNAKQRRSA